MLISNLNTLFLNSSASILPQVFSLNQAFSLNQNNFKMNPYFEGSISNTISQANMEAPSTYSLPKLVEATSNLKLFKDFTGNNEIKTSTDEENVKKLLNIRTGNYSNVKFSDPNLPYEAMAGLLNGELSVWEVSNLLIWHRQLIDYPTPDFSIVPLLDEKGDWINGGETFLGNTKLDILTDLSVAQIEKIRSLIFKLPRSEQVRTTMPFKLPDNFLYEGPEIPQLSLRALGIVLNIVSGNDFGLKPRLGTISKEDIVKTEIEERSRLCYIPFPELLITDRGNRNPTKFSLHDRLHWEIMHAYSPQLVDMFIKLLDETKKLNGNFITQEMWKLADFAFSVENQYGKEKPTNQGDFENFYNTHVSNTEAYLFKWNLVLHSRMYEWKMQYGVDINTIEELNKMNQLSLIAEPYMQKFSTLEKIYFLRKLFESNIFNIDDVKYFFESKPKMPNLCIIKKNDMVQKLSTINGLVA